MFPHPFYPHPQRFLAEGGHRSTPNEFRARFFGRSEDNSTEKRVADEENAAYRLPLLYPKPLGRQDYNVPPPMKGLQSCRSPVFSQPPPKHLVPPWKSTGRISPEMPSPAGHIYPSSPRSAFVPPSPNIPYQCSSPGLSYFSSKPPIRQRTLIEIPRHDAGPEIEVSSLKSEDSLYDNPDERRSTVKPHRIPSGMELYCEMSSREKLGIEVPERSISSRKLSVSESTLDPNCRPFTPSGRYHTVSLCMYDSGPMVDESSCQNEMFAGQSYFEEFGYEDEEQFDFELEYDPLPKDPETLLPDLETSFEDPNNNSALNNNNLSIKQNNNIDKEKPSLRKVVDPLLPPLIPDTAWKTGNQRPPLLPTPVNFPPFGPSKLDQLALRSSIFSDPDKGTKAETPSRILVSGVEQSLNSWIMFGHSPATNVLNSAEKAKRRGTQACSGYLEPGKVPEMMVPPPTFSTGGISSQNLAVPNEYLMSQVIGDRIRPINIRQEHTDLLFFLFYTLHGDALQLVAASLLFERGWRYHKQDRIWLARWPGVKPEEKNAHFEKGLYQYFDMVSWKRIPGWFRLDYCHLADKTMVPEDLKTLYTRYCGLVREIQNYCGRTILLSGLKNEVLVIAAVVVEAGILRKRDATAMSDGDAESIQAFYGFYGSPIYRPYGFSSWGYGSTGFGLHATYVASPNIYGGYV